MRRKDSARGTVYQLAHACGELKDPLDVSLGVDSRDVGPFLAGT